MKTILTLLAVTTIAATMTSCDPQDKVVGSVTFTLYESDVRAMEKAMEKAQADVKAELEKLSK